MGECTSPRSLNRQRNECIEVPLFPFESPSLCLSMWPLPSPSILFADTHSGRALNRSHPSHLEQEFERLFFLV